MRGPSAFGHRFQTGKLQVLRNLTKCIQILNVRLRIDNEGVALTEYLLLLALLVGAVIAAITAFGGASSAIWAAWASFMGALPEPSP